MLIAFGITYVFNRTGGQIFLKQMYYLMVVNENAQISQLTKTWPVRLSISTVTRLT